MRNRTGHIHFLTVVALLCGLAMTSKGEMPTVQPILTHVTIEGESNINRFALVYSPQVLCSKLQNLSNQQSGTNDQRKRFHIPVNQIQCSSQLILKDFRQMVGASKHPEILIDIYPPELEAMRLKGENNTFSFFVTINGVQRKCTGTIRPNPYANGGSPVIDGYAALSLSDFELTPPQKAWGIIKVRDEVEITFRINFVPELLTQN